MVIVSRRRGFTLVELLVVIAIIGILIGLLLPAIQAARESGRRTACSNKMKQIGLGFANAESTGGAYPASSKVYIDRQKGTTEIDGWSWCVALLPYIEQKPLYDRLDFRSGRPLREYTRDQLGGVDPHIEAMQTVIAEFHCPSFSGNAFVDITTQTEAITNYKAMTATHIGSLMVVSREQTIERGYGIRSDHPDGAIYPGSRHASEGLTDGTSHTIMIVESTEQFGSRWTLGLECQVVGLPPDVRFSDEGFYRFYYPEGFEAGAYGDNTAILAENNKTYLDYDYRATPYVGLQEETTYSLDGQTPAQKGPGSDHPGVTNHLFADGSVHTLKNTVDSGAYMFLITRNNGDPTYLETN